MAIIEVHNLTKRFGQVNALEDINFKIESGDIVALVGPNGSGKSTLAKLIVGLDTPTSGTIHIHHEPPTKPGVPRVGYVPQHFALDRTLPMTVFEFLHLSLPGTFSRSVEESIVTSALTRVGIAGLQSNILGTLSGGQLQRVLIARVLLQPHDILVLDEPSASIDVGGEEELYSILQKLNKEDGTTLIIISHELDFVFRFATQVICVNRRLMCRGIPKEVLTKDLLESLYGSHTAHYHHDPNCDHHHHQ